MKSFVKHILKIVLIFVMSAYALDFCFTYVFRHSQPYTKAQYIFSLKNKKFDYIFIGSSRVENSIIPEIIEQKTGKSIINLGIQGATTMDLVFVIDLLKNVNISYEKIFIQLDYKINDVQEYSKKFQTELFPFLDTNNLIDKYVYAKAENKFLFKHLPFYKYYLASHNLGIRKIFLTFFKFSKTIQNNKGYVPLIGSETKKHEILPNYFAKNPFLHRIIKTKNAVFFSCPLHKNIAKKNYFIVMKNTIPNYYDFTSTLTKETYFKDSYHLNTSGANVFSNVLIDKLKL